MKLSGKPRRKHRAGVRVGTSGWMYKDWGEKFYPRDIKKGFLSYLAEEFDTVEINSSFYHLPRPATFAKWRTEVPKDFLFAVKMSRYITHQKRLHECRGPIERFLRAAKELREKLGVVLIQLPPSLRYDEALLGKFIADLQAASRSSKVKPCYALEPRHQSWMEHAPAVRETLKHAKVALVFPHSAKIPSFPPENENILADFIYIRFHGPSEFAASRYGARRLAPWAKRIRGWHRRGLDVFVYFNNDTGGHAIDDARTLKRLMKSR